MNSSIIKKIIFSSIFSGVTAASVATPFIMKYISNKNEIVYDNMVRFFLYSDGTATKNYSKNKEQDDFDNKNYWCNYNRQFFNCTISEVLLDQNNATVQGGRTLTTAGGAETSNFLN